MNPIQEIQEWYLSQCNEDWEHTYGISIDTLDNPGWSVEIDLTDTNLENREFKEQSYGVGIESETSVKEWWFCKVENNKFKGCGGPSKLEEIISIFMGWAKSNA